MLEADQSNVLINNKFSKISIGLYYYRHMHSYR